MKKVIAITLGAMLFAFAPVHLMAKGMPAAAVSPRYAYISELSADCVCENGFATCFGAVFPWGSGYDSQMSMTLQEYNTGKWKDIKTWSGSKTNGGVNLTKTYAVSTSKTYRVRVTGKVLSGSRVLETQTIYG